MPRVLAELEVSLYIDSFFLSLNFDIFATTGGRTRTLERREECNDNGDGRTGTDGAENRDSRTNIIGTHRSTAGGTASAGVL